MIVDFRAADCPTETVCDVCVVGAGPAGIAIALALAGSSVAVCVVESGGLEPDPRTQELCDGESVGLLQGLDLAHSRFRMFGGTTCEWGGGNAPLEAFDFERRHWIPYSGWPIARRDLDPFYARARQILSVPEDRVSDERLVAKMPHRPPEFDRRLLTGTYSLRSGRLHFGRIYRAELMRARNVTVLLNATLMELEVNGSATIVQRALLRSLQGRTGNVRARYFILACGGIENARVLLLSNSICKHGLGNDHDIVGRFFMDHPSGKLGHVIVDKPDRLSRPYDLRAIKRHSITFPQIALAWPLQQEEQVLNGRLRPRVVDEDTPDGIAALRSLRRDLSKGAGRRLPGHIVRVLADLGGVVPGVYRRVLRGLPAVRSYRIELNGFFEQAPNPESRVTLGREADCLGQRKVCLDWRLTDLDRRTYEVAAAAFSAEIVRLGLGKLELDQWMAPASAKFDGIASAAHHMGTTRMSDDARVGVVDPDCRVYGVDNLYIAGSSVFPTGGWAFPTFTIVALALRLSDTVLGRLGMGSAHRSAEPRCQPAVNLRMEAARLAGEMRRRRFLARSAGRQ